MGRGSQYGVVWRGVARCPYQGASRGIRGLSSVSAYASLCRTWLFVDLGLGIQIAVLPPTSTALEVEIRESKVALAQHTGGGGGLYCCLATGISRHTCLPLWHGSDTQIIKVVGLKRSLVIITHVCGHGGFPSGRTTRKAA